MNKTTSRTPRIGELWEARVVSREGEFLLMPGTVGLVVEAEEDENVVYTSHHNMTIFVSGVIIKITSPWRFWKRVNEIL